ncbi:unnamed protein product [Coffea canephora]|uniref:Uncharacterized protein n=1 Tax=Coffea canephora TaxID=49390 RepID=A0A068VAG9_COFCA|nr:unnamed protein product [Coffea canephora]
MKRKQISSCWKRNSIVPCRFCENVKRKKLLSLFSENGSSSFRVKVYECCLDELQVYFVSLKVGISFTHIWKCPTFHIFWRFLLI